MSAVALEEQQIKKTTFQSNRKYKSKDYTNVMAASNIFISRERAVILNSIDSDSSFPISSVITIKESRKYDDIDSKYSVLIA